MSEAIDVKHGAVEMTRFVAGTAFGFRALTPAIQIQATQRPGGSGFIVLSLGEAKAVADAILKHLSEE